MAEEFSVLRELLKTNFPQRYALAAEFLSTSSVSYTEVGQSSCVLAHSPMLKQSLSDTEVGSSCVHSHIPQCYALAAEFLSTSSLSDMEVG